MGTLGAAITPGGKLVGVAEGCLEARPGRWNRQPDLATFTLLHCVQLLWPLASRELLPATWVARAAAVSICGGARG